MAQLRGKQILLNSIDLDRLNINDYTVGDPVTGIDASKVLINKEYADTLAAGWDVKESSRYTTLLNIDNILGTDEASVIAALDNLEFTPGIVELEQGDRILVKDQTDQVENGIYVWTLDKLERAEDFDGTPDHEVSQGAYSFVVEGEINQGYGFMVINTGSLTDGSINVGVDPIIWSRVSKAVAYLGGDGIDINDNVINVDVEAGTGLSFSGTLALQFSLKDYLDSSSAELGDSMDWNGTILDLDYVEVAANLAATST